MGEDQADEHDRADDAEAAQLRPQRVNVAVQRMADGPPQRPDRDDHEHRRPDHGDGHEQAAHPTHGNAPVCSGSGLLVMSDRDARPRH